MNNESLKIEVRGGTLWRGTQKVRLECGNEEQITAIREYEKTHNSETQFLTDGVLAEPTYETKITATLVFNCVCGKRRSSDVECDDTEDASFFDGRLITCHHCNRKYKCEVKSDKEHTIEGKIYKGRSDNVTIKLIGK